VSANPKRKYPQQPVNTLPRAIGREPMHPAHGALATMARAAKAVAAVFAAAVIVAICVAPSLVANAWPRFQAVFEGDRDAALLGTATFQAVAVIVMALAPLAIAWAVRARDIFTGASAAALAIALFAINSGNAIETVNRFRQSVRMKAENLAAQIDRDKGELRGMGQVQPTSDDDVKAAQAAVEAAQQAQTQECWQVGAHCRTRQSETKEAIEQKKSISNQRTLAVNAERLKQQIDKNARALADMGIVPSVSPSEQRWATFYGLVIELLGLLGPLVVMGPFQRKDAAPAQPVPVEAPAKATAAASVPAPGNAPQRAAMPALAALVLKLGRRKAAAIVPEPESAPQRAAAPATSEDPAIDGFAAARLDLVKGSSTPATPLFEAWKEYCAERGIDPGKQSQRFKARISRYARHNPNSGYPIYEGVRLRAKGEPRLRVVASRGLPVEPHAKTVEP
jgi:hypothetical protein